MKIRIGITLGEWSSNDDNGAALLEFVEWCESLDIDSVWVNDRIVSATFAGNVALGGLGDARVRASMRRFMEEVATKT
jgi:hypothetical protein